MALETSTWVPTSTLALQAVRKGRELGELISSIYDSLSGTFQPSLLVATLRRLEAGEITDSRDLVTFDAIRSEVEKRLPAEITEVKEQPVLIGGDHESEVWDTTTVHLYTSQGEQLLALQLCLAKFQSLRQQLLDQITADRLVASLIR